ncbi:unnamed protein product [Cochlearia groenlandica]
MASSSSSSSSPDLYVEGQNVEVCSNEDGLSGSYFEAEILSKETQDGSHYRVQYKTLVTEGDNPQPLIEIVSADELRPRPPKLSTPTSFSRNEKVDVFANDGWWEGHVIDQRGNLFHIHFPATNEDCEYSLAYIRRHHDFDSVNRQWVSSETSLQLKRRLARFSISNFSTTSGS